MTRVPSRTEPLKSGFASAEAALRLQALAATMAVCGSDHASLADHQTEKRWI
jgi:hypothetical protein